MLDHPDDTKSNNKCPHKRETGGGFRQNRRQCSHRGREWSDTVTSLGMLGANRGWKKILP